MSINLIHMDIGKVVIALKDFLMWLFLQIILDLLQTASSLWPSEIPANSRRATYNTGAEREECSWFSTRQ